MILEGIVTTVSAAGAVNVAPMGPHVDADFSHIVLKPFRTSRTYQNLKAHPEGVLHVTDDVLLLARAAVRALQPPPALRPAAKVAGHVLADACRYWEFRVQTLDDRQERTTIKVEVVHAARLRDFFGFNRAKHAVVEAAILATRLHLLPVEEITTEFRRLALLVDKTGGPQELEAFAFLSNYIQRGGLPEGGAA